MSPETPFLAAGAIAIGGGVAREGKWPAEGMSALVGTVVLVIIASATAGSKIAPLVRAIGLLLLLTAVMATTTAVAKTKKVKK